MTNLQYSAKILQAEIYTDVWNRCFAIWRYARIPAVMLLLPVKNEVSAS